MIIAHLTDPHIAIPGKITKDKFDTNAVLKQAVDTILQMDARPDVVIMTGDLTEDGRPEEYQALQEALSPLPQPVYLIPGNHDSRSELKNTFSEANYFPKQDKFLHYTLESYPVRLVGLDTQVTGEEYGKLCSTRLNWLKARLSEEPKKPTVIFMHHPPFATGISGLDKIGLINGDEFGQLVAQYPNIIRVLCGHQHRSAQLLWNGTMACIAPSISYQFGLQLDPNKKAGYSNEATGFLLHIWQESNSMVTHSILLD